MLIAPLTRNISTENLKAGIQSSL